MHVPEQHAPLRTHCVPTGGTQPMWFAHSALLAQAAPDDKSPVNTSKQAEMELKTSTGRYEAVTGSCGVKQYVGSAARHAAAAVGSNRLAPDARRPRRSGSPCSLRTPSPPRKWRDSRRPDTA